MLKGDADGDVALDCHASQVQRSVFSGENNKQDEYATDRDIYFVDGVADDKHHDGQGHLDHVVDHQVNEKYIPRIRVEDLEGENKGRQGVRKSLRSDVR